MSLFCPGSDLWDKYDEIAEYCHTYREPVFLTENGVASLVVMAKEDYERLCGLHELYQKLDEGILAMEQGRTSPAEDVFSKPYPQKPQSND